MNVGEGGMLVDFLSVFASVSVIEALSTVTGVLYVVLMIRESRACWIFGNISVALLSYSCFEVGLFADMTLQWIYFVMGVIGYVQWSPSSESSSALSVSQASGIVRLRSLSAGIVVWMVVYGVLMNLPGARIPILDSLLFAASIVATWFQARKYIDNWLIWIPVNVVYAGLYWSRELPMYAILSVMFAALSFRGWRSWRTRLSPRG